MSRSGVLAVEALGGESAISSQYKCPTLIYFSLFLLRLTTHRAREGRGSGRRETEPDPTGPGRPNGNVSVREISRSEEPEWFGGLSAPSSGETDVTGERRKIERTIGGASSVRRAIR